MTSYRNPDQIERYEDVVFDLETALNTNNPGNNAHQIRNNIRFVVDNRGELPPFDWYHARFDVDFKLQRLDTEGDIVAQDGMVNSAYSLIKKLTVRMNSIDVYDCSEANQATNIKNLLHYSQGYSKSQGTNEFFYIDINRNKQEDKTHVEYNSGFAARKSLLDNQAIVNAEISLNRYSFFESLHDQILPNSKIEIKIEIESDANLCWKTTNDCRVIITKFKLIVPRIIFNAKGKSNYSDNYLIPRKWTYLRELIERGNSTQLQTANFRISTAINKPRHVFVFIINDAQLENYEHNKSMYDTFNVGGDQTMTSCHLEVGKGKNYPEVHYKPNEEPARVFRDVLSYVHANSEYDKDTFLNRLNFKNLFPFIYFDLTKQPTDIKDGMTKLTFKYTLSGAAGAEYSVYALVLHEQNIETTETKDKLILRTM